MRYPVNYIAVTQGFHQGKSIDLGWNNNYGGSEQPIYTVASGTVYRVEVQKTGGNVVFIKHDDGKVSLYAHLSKVLVKKGQKVSLGEQIGNMGKTGIVTGNHLHFGLYSNDKNIYGNADLNPFDYLELYEGQVVNDNTKKNYTIKVHTEDEAIKKVNAKENLNLRESNNTNSTILAELKDGTKVKVLEEKDGWYKVQIEGYVAGNYLK